MPSEYRYGTLLITTALFASACDGSGPEPAPQAPKKQVVEATKPEAEIEPEDEDEAELRDEAAAEPRDMRPFSEQLAKFAPGEDEHDPKVLLKLFDGALDAFVAARPGLDGDDAEAQRAAIDALLSFLDTQAGEMSGEDIEGLSYEAREYAMGFTPETPPTAEELARLEELSTLGVGLYYGDEAMTVVVVDYAAVRERLKPALSPAGLAYLEAIAWERDELGRPSPAWTRMVSANESMGDPQLLAQWEALADTPAGEAWQADEHGHTVLEHYLHSCAVIEHTYFLECVVDDELRGSYEQFLAQHPDSRYRGAIETFLAGAKAKGYRIAKEKQFYALVNAAMAKVNEAG